MSKQTLVFRQNYFSRNSPQEKKINSKATNTRGFVLLGVFFLFLKMKSSWEIVLRVTYLYLDKKHAEAGHETLQVCCVLSCDNHVVYNLRPPF